MSPPLPSTRAAPPVLIEQTFIPSGFCRPVKPACLRDARNVAVGAPVLMPTPHLGPPALRRPFPVVLLLLRKIAHLPQQGSVLTLEAGMVAITELATAGLVCRIVLPKYSATCSWGSSSRSFLSEFPKEESRSVWTPTWELSGCPEARGLCGQRTVLTGVSTGHLPRAHMRASARGDHVGLGASFPTGRRAAWPPGCIRSSRIQSCTVSDPRVVGSVLTTFHL